MNQPEPLILTPGPWGWRQPAGSRKTTLCSMGRGLLIILDPARAGMHDATIRFGHRTAAERGGILKEVPVRSHRRPDFLTDNELTPDGRLIQAAPALLSLLKEILATPGGSALPIELRVEGQLLVERITMATAPVATEGGAS